LFVSRFISSVFLDLLQTLAAQPVEQQSKRRQHLKDGRDAGGRSNKVALSTSK
jgi:hypothetical protein